MIHSKDMLLVAALKDVKIPAGLEGPMISLLKVSANEANRLKRLDEAGVQLEGPDLISIIFDFLGLPDNTMDEEIDEHGRCDAPGAFFRDVYFEYVLDAEGIPLNSPDEKWLDILKHVVKEAHKNAEDIAMARDNIG